MYCEKNEDIEKVAHVTREEARLAHKIVLDLRVDTQGKGHVIHMDNFFTSVGIFEELASMQINAIGIIRLNQIELPLALKNRGAFRNAPYSTLKCRMHKTHKMACILWKDKKQPYFF